MLIHQFSVLNFSEKFTELQSTVNEIAPLNTGIWRLSVTGIVSDLKNGLVQLTSSDRSPVVQKK